MIVDGTVPIRDLNRAMDWDLPDEEATTIAGLVIHEAQTIPEPGQAFTFHGFRFEVLRRQRNRITALRVTPLAKKRAKAKQQGEPSLVTRLGPRALLGASRADRKRVDLAGELLGQHLH